IASMASGTAQLLAKAGEGWLNLTPSGLLLQAVAPNLKDQAHKAVDNVSRQANKFADHIGQQFYENRETIDTVVTVAATVAAPLSGGSSLLILGALAAYKT
ncbi:hypothetical protein QRD38_18235, partial [Leptospira weilii]|nr:hypothetical protein [Leptospira weilii]